MTSTADPTRKHIRLGRADVASGDVTTSGRSQRRTRGRRGGSGSGKFVAAVDGEREKPSAVGSRAELVEIIVEHRLSLSLSLCLSLFRQHHC